MKIVDGKKELIINAAGKNMSPANIENKLKAASPAVLAGDEWVKAAVAAAVTEANTQLARVEQIKRHTILPVDWEPGGDRSTPWSPKDLATYGQIWATTVPVPA